MPCPSMMSRRWQANNDRKVTKVMTLRVTSYGGGVQSTSLLVLAAQNKIDYKTFLFCNVGDDSEHPDTIKYVHEVAMPYAKEHGIELVELQKTLFGEPHTLYQELMRPDSRSISIPVHMLNGGPGTRNCTATFKIKVVDKELKRRDTTGEIKALRKAVLKRYGVRKMDEEIVNKLKLDLDDFFKTHDPFAYVGIGISLDEFQRVKPNLDPDTLYWKVNAFPLIDLRMDRQDCINVIKQAGIPVPPKSSCYFCPFHSTKTWQNMRNNEPELFRKTIDLERIVNERRAMLGKEKVWFSSRLKPLEKVTTDLEQGSLFDNGDIGCDSGYCFL